MDTVFSRTLSPAQLSRGRAALAQSIDALADEQLRALAGLTDEERRALQHVGDALKTSLAEVWRRQDGRRDTSPR